MTDGTGQRLYEDAKTIIPGGVQLLSKRPEMFAPKRWPAYYRSAVGCEVVDLDGRTYVDFTHNGVGACLLGYAHPRVVGAVIDRVQRGAQCTLNAPEEVAVAKRLVALHPWAEQVRFGRGGGEAMAIAVRIVRAATGRDVIALCGYHGWSDWYLSANLDADKALDGHLLPGLSPAGVPRGLVGTALPFAYNKLQDLAAIFANQPDRVAAVVMEPTRATPPAEGFLEGVRAMCDRHGARLVFDEVTTGFRLRRGGVHLDYAVAPDVAVFAKALGNGHPISAIVGRRQTMEAAQDTFISSTAWTDAVGSAAALATLEMFDEIDVPAHVRTIGERFRGLVADEAMRAGLSVKLGGYPALTTIGFDHPDAAALGTLYTVRMLERGFLAGGAFYPTLAHNDARLDSLAKNLGPVFAELAQAAEQRDAANRLEGHVKHSGFARLA